MKKNILLTLFSMSVFLFGNILISNASEIDNITSYEVTVFDFENDKVSEKHIQKDTETLEPTEHSGFSLFSVIGKDERQKIYGKAKDHYPSSAIGVIKTKFSNGSVFEGTAFLVGKNDIVTAGHCGWRKEYGKAISSEFIIGGKIYKLKSLTIPSKYKIDNDNFYDYAVGEISENLGYSRGVIRPVYEDPNEDFFTIIGFPGDKPREEGNNSMYISFGQKLYMNDLLIVHDADTYAGMSGSPLFIGFTKEDTRAIAVHTRGVETIDGISGNSGIRFHDEFMSLVNEYVKK